MIEIQKYLLEKGFKPAMKGFKYIAYAVVMAKEDFECVHHITKMIYPKIAKEFKDTPGKVARAIRYCKEYSNFNETNSNLIARLAIELSMQN